MIPKIIMGIEIIFPRPSFQHRIIVQRASKK